MMEILLGFLIGTCIGNWIWHIRRDSAAPPKGKTLQDLSDDELRLVASAFIHDLTQEIEKREKQDENKPFDEFM